MVAAPRCTVISTAPSTRILPIGITMLAMNTISASGHDPEPHRKITPDMIVSESDPVSVVVVSTGSRFAGT